MTPPLAEICKSFVFFFLSESNSRTSSGLLVHINKLIIGNIAAWWLKIEATCCLDDKHWNLETIGHFGLVIIHFFHFSNGVQVSDPPGHEGRKIIVSNHNWYIIEIFQEKICQIGAENCLSWKLIFQSLDLRPSQTTPDQVNHETTVSRNR